MKALRRIQTRSSLPNPSSPLFSSPSSPWTHLRSAFVLVTSSSPASCSSSSDPHRLKSSWSRRKRKKPLTLRRWKRFFTPEGRLENGGVALLKKVRNRGIDPSIRSEVWPFLLGVYDFNSSKEERSSTRTWRRKAYERLRRQCRRLQRRDSGTFKLNKINKTTQDGHYVSWSLAQYTDSSCSDDHEPLLSDRDNAEDIGYVSDVSCSLEIDYAGSRSLNSESSGSDSSDENDSVPFFPSSQVSDGSTASPSSVYISRTKEDFVTWQRIIRLDALRADTEWTPYSSSQATVSEDKARRAAEAVVLKDYSHLEPWKIYHAARLVAVLEAYALHDPEIGYCQGMSDLLSPILSVIPDDHEAFWCFVGFMKKARQNFRLDEVGITRQLKIVSKMIKYKDLKLYKHLEKVKAEDCFFVYRMVLVMFRRELSLEQTLYLWEVMWADEASTRGGVGISSWSRRIKHHAPPTDDLLLYVIAASVLQRRKLIIEKYSSMEEILGDCHNMVGKLDVWKLLDDAHDLIINLHTKIEHSTP